MLVLRCSILLVSALFCLVPGNAQAPKKVPEEGPDKAPVKEALVKEASAKEAPGEAVDGLSFRDPFSALSANEIRDKLIVFVITDEDPLQWSKDGLEKADRSRLGVSRDIWCGNAIRRSFHKLFQKRPDLKDRCIVQRVVAGLPANLTGDKPNVLPRRAIVAFCDGKYQLLNFNVGVPDPEDLLDQLEDAEENKALISLHGGDPAKLTEAVSKRTEMRLRRAYSDALKKLAEPMAGDESIDAVDQAWIAKYARFVSELMPVYLFDVKLRFGLSDASDLIRLLILEQHCETRKALCETLAPHIVGRPFQIVMNPLVDTTWGLPAVIDLDKSNYTEVLRWFETRRENSTIVLAIKPNLLDQDLPWPPPNVKRNLRGQRTWADLESAMSDHSYRAVTAEELAVILHENDEMPFDLLSPSRTRYVVFEPKKRKQTIIRERDVPGKFINRLTVK